MNIYDSKEYKRSRIAYIAESVCEYFVTLLVSDVFLAKLLHSAGMNDSLIGVISSVTALAFVFQIFSFFLVKIKLSTKYLIMIMDFISVSLFTLMYFTPFMQLKQAQKAVVLAVFILVATVTKHMIFSMIFKFGNSYVDPEKRARFSATREIASLVSGLFFTPIVGYIFDKYEFSGNINGGFLFIFCLLLILNITNLTFFGLIKKESSAERSGDSEPIGVVLKNTIGNKPFRKIIVINVLFNCSLYFTIGFMGIYKTKELMYSSFSIQLINIIASAVRALISKPFGKFSDKNSYACGMKWGMIIAATAFFINIFTSTQTRYLVIVFTILYHASYAGTNQNSYNITYNYVNPKYLSQAIAIKNCIGGLLGFGASLIGGKILSFVQENGNMLWGIKLQGQQLLSLISCVVMLYGVFYLNKNLLKSDVK